MSGTFFDTNVLLYMFDDGEQRRKAAAISVFSEAVERGGAVLSTQVLQEFYVNATRKLATPLSAERAAARVRDFAQLPVVKVDEALVLAAIDRHREMTLSFWDALIVEAALRTGADTLLTEDLQHGERIGSLTVQNPFIEADA